MRLPKTPFQVVAASGAAVLNGDGGVITTESLSTAAGGTYTLTIGCNEATANSVVLPALAWGSNSAGLPVITDITPTEGKIVIVVTNVHASAALNGTLVIGLVVFN